MMLRLRFRSLRKLRRCALAAALAGLLPAAAAHAQTRWTIDPKSSLAWWQMSPNLNHLWATTCPGEPSWRPGEGRSSGWYINPKLKLPSTGYAAIQDTVHVPLFPRGTVTPICVEAVRGEVVVADTAHWRGVLGSVAVKSDALITGESMRDVMMHQVMQSMQYPEIHFTLDSLVDLTRQADTMLGRALGTLTIRGMPLPTTAMVKAFPDAGGMRVLAKMRIPAHDLLDITPKLRYLGLGVHTTLWRDLFMGADLVFHPEARGAN